MRSTNIHRSAALTFGVVLASLVPFVRADPNSDFEQTRQDEQKAFDKLIGAMPAMSERTLSGLMRIGAEKGVLVLRTPLANTDHEGFMRVKVTDMGLTALVRVAGITAKSPSPQIPSIFQFSSSDCRKPLQVTRLAVTMQPTTFTINKSWRLADGRFGIICLTQQAGENSVGSPVRLTVSETARDGDPPINIELKAADFFSLVRLNPRETDAYLRPVLIELGQPAAFAPDPLVAFQVFTEIWAPDPATSAKVKALLPALDQDDFRGRGRALVELENLGREGAGVLLHLDRSKLTPEQNARIDLALGPYKPLRMRESLRLRSDPDFLLDCLYCDEVALRKAALGRLREIVDPGIEFDVAGAPDARAAQLAAMREKMNRKGRR